jgi:UrcA family protein
MHMLRHLVSTATLMVTCAATGAARIAPPVSATVVYGDLDLATQQGQAALDRRIQRTAQVSCDTVNPQFAASVRRAQRQCRAEITQAALAAMAARRPTDVAARSKALAHAVAAQH